VAEKNRSALIKEGRKLVADQEASGWRLAEIVHELREDGMTLNAIATELGMGLQSTRTYAKLDVQDPALSFSDSYALAALSEDRAAAVKAVSESEGIALGTAERFRRTETKAIAAEIADLPAADKEQIARELAAGDREFTAAVNRAQFEEATARREKTASRHAADTVGRGFDGQIALKTLQVETNRFIQKARSLFPEIGVIPDAERFWLKGEADSLDDVVAELRHMADTGTTRQETELQQIAETS
jgi:hypothetical protein